MKSRTAAALVASGIALSLALAGCSSSNGGSSSGADATVAIGSLYEPTNLSNVDGGGQGVNEAFQDNVYEGLFRLGDDGKVTPLLATSYKTSSDGLTYTFTLRKGVKFHDGGTLTSADVKSSIERVTAEDSQSSRKSSLAVVKSIATPDDDTVEVTLSKRSISFVYNLSYVWIVPADATKLKTEENGTGPYTLGTFKRGSSLTLEPFADYWGKKPANGGVEFDYFTSASTLSNALASGRVDVVTSIQSPDALSRFTADTSKYTVSEGDSTTKELLAFNDAKGPFTDVKLRQAISAAVDRKALLKAIWGDYGTVNGSMVPPTDPWYQDLTSVNAYDPAKAKDLLAQAGHADGFTFTLDTPSYDPHPAVAQYLQSALKKVGVTVDINTISADEWYTKVYQQHDFEATLQEHVNDRDVVFYGDPDFYFGYDNADVQQDIADAEQATSEDQQTELLKQANEQIVKDAASDWLYLYPQIVVSDKDVTGYWKNGLNSQFPVSGITVS
ncbi:ABC transporter substrate-binding protein [Curtobacterium sp. VKM Ac-2865]|uniref:ABC transporter substrate-binding protein n=1 Tax=Curtobacterium sp. VKM Ac-2865 TaxID=2783817 RepID=UPI00188B679C|nr:ABC transporter substrate-binding protein [Curtobacterium sp. VKM Ac-2865]MBF4582766.1 ABC transporter substrate-binding protein [Curtobacterium sp. VKM Ac-2865]